jgi:hypothetical protein
MSKRLQLAVVVLLGATRIGLAQQVSDLTYKPPVPRPAYESGKGVVGQFELRNSVIL